jgi:hypothetical protein
MSLIQESYIRNFATQRLKNDSRYSAYSSASSHDVIRKSLLSESYLNFSVGKSTFDIFLSHSYSDKELILGIKTLLENFDYSVYVDWVEDYSMDRCNITKDNVLWIKERMKTSKCLLYATSSNSSSSKWMPWELGFMDGFKRKVAIFPIAQRQETSYKGNEYLGIYPYVEITGSNDPGINLLWVTDQSNRKIYAEFNRWLNGNDLTLHNE